LQTILGHQLIKDFCPYHPTETGPKSGTVSIFSWVIWTENISLTFLTLSIGDLNVVEEKHNSYGIIGVAGEHYRSIGDRSER
jgi:hypothetical protein